MALGLLLTEHLHFPSRLKSVSLALSSPDVDDNFSAREVVPGIKHRETVRNNNNILI